MSQATGRLRVDRLPSPFEAAGEWTELDAACGNPFTSWQWASTWWRHFGAERELELEVLGMRDERGELKGIVPLYRHMRRPLRVLRFVGHFPADQLGPVCAPADFEAVVTTLRRHLAEARDWDLLLLERVADGTGTPSLLGARTLRSEPTPELKLPETEWDEFLANRSSNFRSQVRKFERRLLRDNDLRFRIAEDPERLDADMESFFELHDARWAGQGEGAFTEPLKRFHRDLAHAALEAGWLRLCFAELDGKPAAAWYGFRLGNADWFYQQGRDPAWDRASVGFVLTMQTIREAIESGVGAYKFLMGTEEYKGRFATDEPAVETLALTRGARGRLALGLASLRSRIR